MKSGILLSVVIPAYNEAEGIATFHKKLLLPNITKITKNSYEIIYVNDGSKDETLSIISEIAKNDKNTKVISLSRNFGKEIATSAGIEFAKGEAIIIMDSDGQHPPELMHEFMKKWRAGTQVVVGVRSSDQKAGVLKSGALQFFTAYSIV